jgi:hypothetical protein
MTITEPSLTADEQRVNSLVDQLLAEFPPKTTSPIEFLGAQFDKACVRSGLPDPIIAALIGVSVEQMWDIRTGAAIAPAALAAVSAFVAGEL